MERILKIQDEISAVAWSPDGSQLLVASEGAVRLWNVKACWHCIFAFLTDTILSLFFSTYRLEYVSNRSKTIPRLSRPSSGILIERAS